jgi:hypothetical protein
VTPIPADGQQPKIVLRNTGGQVANVTGWKLSTGDAASNATSGQVLTIADAVRCRANGTVPSGQALVFLPKSERNPCGFEFNLSGR